MIEECWDDDDNTSKPSEQPPTVQKLGIGRGKLSFSSINTESGSAPQWKGGSTSTTGSRNSFRNNNNNENSNPDSSRSFGTRDADSNFGVRSGFGVGNSSGAFRANNDGNTRGHTSRDCPEPKKNTRGGRGDFNFGANDRNNGFRKTENTFRNLNNPNSSNRDNSNESKPTFTGRRGGLTNAMNNNNSNSIVKRTTFSNPSTRGSSTNTGGEFRGARGGINSGDRENRASNNCYNCNQPGHRSRDCPEQKQNRGDASGFFAGERKHDKVSDDIFDQPGGRPVERYIPPPVPVTEADIFGETVTKGENFGKYHRTQVRCTPEGKIRPIELYEEANLGTKILSNIRRAHFDELTTIQRYAIPCIREQYDLMACAQTGSGKTAAFLLPIISNLLEYHADELSERYHPPSPLCLVVSPTRELALQTEREARKFAYQTSIIPCSAVGGHDMFTVTDRLREGCHILSATTGRLKDMVEKGRISLKKVKYFILDEADRMLDTGFEPDIRKLQDLGLPSVNERVTSMFSATFPDQVQRLAKHFLRENYIFLAVGILGGANEDIAQTIELVPQANKKDRLFQLLEEKLKSERCLIFVETKRSADYIGALLSQRNFMSTTMHGDRTQRQRIEAVQQFTNGKCPILVATSVAARGLDFPLIGYVINYDLPDTSDFYIHRIGRTGRAGHLGKSISFFDPDRESDRNIAFELIQKLTEAGQQVPDFLRKQTDNNKGFNHGDFPGRNTDMRSGIAAHRQTGGVSGGTATAGEAEDWD